MGITVVLPIRTVSEANSHEHWRKRQKRAKEQRFAARFASGISATGVAFPCVVTLTRISPRELDSDNLAISQKSVRDGVADAMGINDRDPRVTWRYAQRRGKPKEYAVEIRIDPREPAVGGEEDGLGKVG